MELNRYNCWEIDERGYHHAALSELDNDGEWCLYEEAAAEIARLTARVAELEEAADCIQCERDGLKQGVEFWKSAAEAQRRKNCDECVRIAEGKMVAKLQARVAELEAYQIGRSE